MKTLSPDGLVWFYFPFFCIVSGLPAVRRGGVPVPWLFVWLKEFPYHQFNCPEHRNKQWSAINWHVVVVICRLVPHVIAYASLPPQKHCGLFLTFHTYTARAHMVIHCRYIQAEMTSGSSMINVRILPAAVASVWCVRWKDILCWQPVKLNNIFVCLFPKDAMITSTRMLEIHCSDRHGYGKWPFPWAHGHAWLCGPVAQAQRLSPTQPSRTW